jgi:hypothetical protein
LGELFSLSSPKFARYVCHPKDLCILGRHYCLRYRIRFGMSAQNKGFLVILIIRTPTFVSGGALFFFSLDRHLPRDVAFVPPYRFLFRFPGRTLLFSCS